MRSAPKPGFDRLRSNLYCCDDGSAQKYWALYARDNKNNGPVVTVWGRLGGKMRVSDYNGGASTDIPKLIQSKVAKGYKPYQGVQAWDRPASLRVSPVTQAWLFKQTPGSAQKAKGTSKPCTRDEIRNPASGRCVSRSGRTGKRLLSGPPKFADISPKSSGGKKLGEIRKHKKHDLFYIWEYNPDTERPAWLRFDTWRHGTWRRSGNRTATSAELQGLQPKEQKAAMKKVEDLWYEKNKKKSQEKSMKQGSKPCARDQIRNPESGRCVSRSGPTGKRLLSKPSKSKSSGRPLFTSAIQAADLAGALLDKEMIATGNLLKRIGKERAKTLKPPKSMLLTTAQMARVRQGKLALPVVPPWPRQKPRILYAFDREIAEDYFWEHQGLAVVDDALVWWVITPRLIAWLEKQL